MRNHSEIEESKKAALWTKEIWFVELQYYLIVYTNLLAELSFVTLTIRLCNGVNDKNLVKPRNTCFLTV